MLHLLIEPPLIFLASLTLTRLTLKYLRKRAILDRPNHRSSHTVPTPRGGGIAVICVSLVFLLWGARLQEEWLGYTPIIGAAILAGISWLDDIHDLSARLRFGIQICLAGASIPWLLQQGSLFQGILPQWLEVIFILLSWVAFINFFNFMDGIDGITGVETASVGFGLTLVSLALATSFFTLPLQEEIFLPGLVLAVAALGFLVWNWHPAKIFLGDVGSVPLGYLLGGFLLLLACQGYWSAALILPGYYLADAGLTLLKRMIRRERVWEAHRDHYYQRAVQSGRSHAQVSLAIALVNILLIGLSVWSLQEPLLALVCAVPAVLLLLAWMNRKPQGQGAQA